MGVHDGPCAIREDEVQVQVTTQKKNQADGQRKTFAGPDGLRSP